jgi:predicted nucleotidyltransferase
MSVLSTIQQSISNVGVKEVARRTGLSASTVSRIGSGKINPSLDVVEKISDAIGFQLKLSYNTQKVRAPRLNFAKDILSRLRNELKSLGVKHMTIFGSAARGTDNFESDIDIYIEFSKPKLSVAKLLKAEGKIIEAFGENKVDIVSDLSSPNGQKLKLQIDKDGHLVF